MVNREDERVITKVHCWVSHHKKLLKRRDFLRSLMEWTSEADILSLREPRAEDEHLNIWRIGVHAPLGYLSISTPTPNPARRSQTCAKLVPVSVAGQREFNMMHKRCMLTEKGITLAFKWLVRLAFNLIK